MNQTKKTTHRSSILNLFTIGDKILIFSLILLSIMGTLAVKNIQQQGNTVTIKVAGKIVHSLNLKQDQELVVNGPVGQTHIQIQHGKVRVVSSDCPHKICVKTGWIHKSGDLIVCVPNKVVITIEGENNNYFNVITQ